jgi:hypothetical protein
MGQWIRWLLFMEGVLLFLALAGPGSSRSFRQSGDNHALFAGWIMENPSYLDAVLVNFVILNFFMLFVLLAAWLVARFRAEE